MVPVLDLPKLMYNTTWYSELHNPKHQTWPKLHGALLCEDNFVELAQPLIDTVFSQKALQRKSFPSLSSSLSFSFANSLHSSYWLLGSTPRTMSQEPEDMIAGLDIFTSEQKYVRKHMKDWPLDENDEDHIRNWPEEDSVLIVPERNVFDDHIHYTSTIATNCPNLHMIDQFQEKMDALPSFKIPRTKHHTEMELRNIEDQWVKSNSQSACASQQDFIQCIRDSKPESSFYSDISDTAFEKLSARESTNIYHQSQAKLTTNQGIALLENKQNQAAESEADVDTLAQGFGGSGWMQRYAESEEQRGSVSGERE